MSNSGGKVSGENSILNETGSAVPEKCQKVDSVKKDICIANTAVEEKDLSLCGKLSSESLSYYCKGKIEGNKSLCRKVEDSYLRNNCLTYLDEKSLGTDDSENVSEEISTVEGCENVVPRKKDICVAEKAIRVDELDLCGDVGSEEVNKFCRGILLGNKSLCKEVDDSFLRNNCTERVQG